MLGFSITLLMVFFHLRINMIKLKKSQSQFSNTFRIVNLSIFPWFKVRLVWRRGAVTSKAECAQKEVLIGLMTVTLASWRTDLIELHSFIHQVTGMEVVLQQEIEGKTRVQLCIVSTMSLK